MKFLRWVDNFSAVLAASCLLAAACATLARADEIVTVASAAEVEELNRQIQAQLQAALERGEAARRKWPRLQWSGVECYDPRPVRKSFDLLKKEVRGAATDPRLSALDAYLQTELERRSQLPKTMLISVPSVFPGRMERRIGLPVEQTDSSWAEVRDLVQSFLGSARLAVDVDITSEPGGAKVQLQTGSRSDQRRTLSTTSRLKNLWRGLYRMSMEKPGYKPSALDLDLVNQGSTKVACKLVRAADEDDSRCSQSPLR